MDAIDWIVAIIVTLFVVGGALALYADAVGKHPWEDKDEN
jgi:hypothetical protein